MTILVFIIWTAMLFLLAGAVALAFLASGHNRQRLVLWCVGFVAVAIILAALGGASTAPTPAFTIGAAIGLLLLGVIAGSPLVTLVLDVAGGSPALGVHGGIMIRDSSPVEAEREILRGGMTIGYLERLALVGAALAGQFAALALIVAIKGLGRFSELENAAARERFIIGTLVSLIWAAACVAPIVL